MSLRSDRVASLVKEEVGKLFQRRFSMEEVGLMTVTEVRVSPDLRQARIYVSVFGDDERKKRTLAVLEENKHLVRSTVGKAVRLRFTPEIAFVLDETMDKAMNLEEIFRKIHSEERSRSDHSTEDGR